MSQSSRSEFELDSDDDIGGPSATTTRLSHTAEIQNPSHYESDYDWSQEMTASRMRLNMSEHYHDLKTMDDHSSLSRPSTPGISSTAESHYEDMNHMMPKMAGGHRASESSSVASDHMPAAGQRSKSAKRSTAKKSSRRHKDSSAAMGPPNPKRVYRGQNDHEYAQPNHAHPKRDALMVESGFIAQRYNLMEAYADQQQARIANMSDEQLDQLIKQVESYRDRWMRKDDMMVESMEEFITMASELVVESVIQVTKDELDDRGGITGQEQLKLDVQKITNAYMKTVKKYHNLMDEVIYRTPLDPNRKRLLTAEKAAVIRRMEGMFETIRHFFGCQTIDLMSIGQANLNLIQMQDLDLKKDHLLEVCNMFLNRLKSLNIRRGPSVGMFYIEEYTPDNKATRYWKEFMTIEEWIRAEIDLNVGDNQHWFFKTLGNHGQPWLLKYFLQCGESAIPTIEYQRCKYSFLNGIWDVNKNIFLPYDHPKFYDHFPGTTQTYGYYQANLASQYFDPDTGHFIEGSVDPMDLKCDMVDHIFDTQLIPKEAQRWYWIHCARMHRVANCDGFEWSMFIEGIAHSGKSTLVHYNLEAVPISRRLVIPSQGETHFATDSFLGRDRKCVVDLIACAEVDKYFSIPQGQINSWISGEGVGGPSKGATMKYTPKWTAAFLAVGNWYFHWDNSQGQVTRRFPKIVFTKIPKTHRNITLEMIRQDMPNYLLKANLIYHQWWKSICEARKHPEMYGPKAGSTNIYDHLPPYFAETLRKQLAERSPQVGLLSDEKWITITGDARDTIKFETLRWGVTAYQLDAGIINHHQVKISREVALIHALKTVARGNEALVIDETTKTVSGLCLTLDASAKIESIVQRQQGYNHRSHTHG